MTTSSNAFRRSIAGFAGAVGTTACLLGSAAAARLDFSGDLGFHNEVATFDFTLDRSWLDAAAWTDSYQGGLNFDPITSLWRQDAGDWLLMGQNDDRPDIVPGQTVYDSGLRWDVLDPGSYRLTVSPYDNFANGDRLSAGFIHDAEQPIGLDQWCQPANFCGMGTSFNLHVQDGLSIAPTAPVPEPSSVALTALGLVAMGLVVRRRRAAARPALDGPGQASGASAVACAVAMTPPPRQTSPS